MAEARKTVKREPRAYLTKPRRGRIKGRDPVRLVIEADSIEDAVRKALKAKPAPKKR